MILLTHFSIPFFMPTDSADQSAQSHLEEGQIDCLPTPKTKYLGLTPHLFPNQIASLPIPSRTKWKLIKDKEEERAH